MLRGQCIVSSCLNSPASGKRAFGRDNDHASLHWAIASKHCRRKSIFLLTLPTSTTPNRPSMLQLLLNSHSLVDSKNYLWSSLMLFFYLHNIETCVAIDIKFIRRCKEAKHFKDRSIQPENMKSIRVCMLGREEEEVEYYSIKSSSMGFDFGSNLAWFRGEESSSLSEVHDSISYAESHFLASKHSNMLIKHFGASDGKSIIGIRRVLNKHSIWIIDVIKKFLRRKFDLTFAEARTHETPKSVARYFRWRMRFEF